LATQGCWGALRLNLDPLPFNSVLGAFLLAFPALFSIVNPIGASLIFSNVTQGRSHAERLSLAKRISWYSLMILLGSLLLGGYILNFFGISLAALRIGGGLVVAIRAWGLLTQPEEHEDRKQTDADPAASGQSDVAFFPLTMPFTTGPGSIAVAIALASERPASGEGVVSFFVGISLAAVLVCALVWIFYRSSDRVLAFLGQSGARVLTRLVAFLLLCIGVQILSNGAQDMLRPLLQPVMHAGVVGH
jgi:multiple antibiotic resistance protein